MNETAEKLQARVRKGSPKLSRKFARLVSIIEGCSPPMVAFSGGVDSSFLTYVASAVDGRTLCATASSETYTPGELGRARAFARKYGIKHIVARTAELKNPLFASNPRDRCYHCKREMLAVLEKIARRRGCASILIGETVSDADDYRPGHAAVEERGAMTPLADAGLSKADVRALSRLFGLETWDAPQNACLASRFAYGEKITAERLRVVARAESLLRRAKYMQVRVRVSGRDARIEIGKDERVDLGALRRIARSIKRMGFAHVSLDLDGYRGGSMNE